MSAGPSNTTVVILNPQSGSADHERAIRERAEQRGYALELTERAGDAVALARQAADAGAETVVAAGGDGTVNEVVHGLDRAGAFDRVTLGVVPVGTGNNFAKNLGVQDLDAAFDALESGDRRRVDLGQADGRPFVNSCVAGVTADSSSETSAEMKNRLGVLAYVLTTLRSISNFEALRLSVAIDDGDAETTAWSGDALCVLVGNGRRFTASGRSEQADMEDGRFEVTVIEHVSALDLMSDSVLERLLGQDAAHLVRLQAPALSITVHDPGTTRFSLDGEIVQQGQLSLSVRPDTLWVRVGETYDPHPDGG